MRRRFWNLFFNKSESYNTHASHSNFLSDVTGKTEGITLNSFLGKSILWHVTLLFVIVFAYTTHEYHAWQKQSQLEVDKIKQITLSNLESYEEIAQSIVLEIFHKGGVSNTLDIDKLNRLYSLKEGYNKIDDFYFIENLGHEERLYNKFGRQNFAILPGTKFFEHLKEKNGTAFKIEEQVLYLGNKVSEDNYLVLKIDLNDFISQASKYLGISGQFSVNNSPNNHIDIKKDNSLKLNEDLSLYYIPQSFSLYVENKLALGIAVVLLFFCGLSFWILQFRRFFKWIMHEYTSQRVNLYQQNLNLSEKIESLDDVNKNLEASYKNTTEFYCNLISTYALELGEYFNINDNQTGRSVSVSDVIVRSRSIVYPELNKNQIECHIEVTEDSEIDYKRSVSLSIVLLNLLFQSIYKTPKNGSISIKLNKHDEEIYIRVQDNGFNLAVNQKALSKAYAMFLLTEVSLNAIAIAANIKIRKSSTDQSNIVDLVIEDQISSKPIDTTEHGNIIRFPAKV